jgi:hypothetical protein
MVTRIDNTVHQSPCKEDSVFKFSDVHEIIETISKPPQPDINTNNNNTTSSTSNTLPASPFGVTLRPVSKPAATSLKPATTATVPSAPKPKPVLTTAPTIAPTQGSQDQFQLILERLGQIESRIEEQISHLSTAVVGVLELLSGDVRHNAIMAERLRRQEWNKGHPLDLLEVFKVCIFHLLIRY